MAEEQDYKKLYEQEKKKVNVLSQRLLLYEDDPTRDGYHVLVFIQNQTIQFLRGFKIQEEIKKPPKEDAVYSRAMDMLEKLPKMINSISELKQSLKITPEEEAAESGKQRVTPESMAAAIGDNKQADV